MLIAGVPLRQGFQMAPNAWEHHSLDAAGIPACGPNSSEVNCKHRCRTLTIPEIPKVLLTTSSATPRSKGSAIRQISFCLIFQQRCLAAMQPVFSGWRGNSWKARFPLATTKGMATGELQIPSSPYCYSKFLNSFVVIIKGGKDSQQGNNGIKTELPDFANKNTRQPVKLTVNKKYLETDLHIKIVFSEIQI